MSEECKKHDLPADGDGICEGCISDQVDVEIQQLRENDDFREGGEEQDHEG